MENVLLLCQRRHTPVFLGSPPKFRLIADRLSRMKQRFRPSRVCTFQNIVHFLHDNFLSNVVHNICS